MTNTQNFEKIFTNKSKRTFKNLTEYKYVQIYKHNNTKYDDIIKDLTTTKTMHYIPGDYSNPIPIFKNNIQELDEDDNNNWVFLTDICDRKNVTTLFAFIKSKTLPFNRCHLFYVCRQRKHTNFTFVHLGLLSQEKNKFITNAVKKIGLQDRPLPKRLIEPKTTKSGRSVIPPKRFRESQSTEIKSNLKVNQNESSIERITNEDKTAPISHDTSLDQLQNPTQSIPEIITTNGKTLQRFNIDS